MKEVMDIKNLVELKVINGKKVYIFEHHHYALNPWSILKAKLEEEISLLSFDYHTDTNEPFLQYSYDKMSNSINREMMRDFVNNMNYYNINSINAAITKLKNDEHILAAIRSGLIDKAFIISQSGKETPTSNEERNRRDKGFSDEDINNLITGAYEITPKRKRTYPDSEIYIPDFEYCDEENEADVLCDCFLKHHLSELSRISGLITDEGDMKTKYILDFDLDYFLVPEAVEPISDNIAKKLINKAEIITIAKESECVKHCSGDRCNSENLLMKIIELINKATE